MTDESRPMTRRRALGVGSAAIGGLSVAGVSAGADDDETEHETETDPTAKQDDDGERTYRATVANLTPGQPFTPPVVAAHDPSVEVFAVGEEANTPTQEVAENGNLDPLVELVEATDAITGVAVGESPLVPKDDPGDTGNPYYAILEFSASADSRYVTFIAMLVATNDGIVGLDTVPLPEEVNASRTYYANGYDVGTEENTERYEDLVPPAQTLVVGGEGGGTTESDPELSEDDVIRPHAGISVEGDLEPEIYDWDEPAGLVVVERLS